MSSSEAGGARPRLLGRRAAIQGSALALAGLSAAALIGCGGDDDNGDSGGASSPGGTATQPAATPAAGSIEVGGRTIGRNFPEPEGKTPKSGGTGVFAVTWDIATMDPTKSAAGGTIAVPNVVYDRLLGFKRGPDA